MKLRYVAAALAVNLCTGALVTLSHAEEQDGKAPTAKKADPGVLREARGKVKDIDKDKNQVVVDGAKKDAITLKVDKSTTIFIDGRIGSLDEIQPGGEVRASYEFRQGANRAQWIEVSKKEQSPSPGKEQLPEAPAVPEGTPPPAVPQ